jgi:adenylate cyclase class IV
MGINIEIKARIRDLEGLRKRAEALSDTPCRVISQEDTFFYTPQGRLKLRNLEPDRGELIYYVREDAAGPKRSNYLLCATTDPVSLEAVLEAALAVRGVVRKRRSLYHVGETRIHLDEVEGLGSFVELEVVLGFGQSEDEGQAIAAKLMAQLGIEETDLVEGAYIDLLQGPDSVY